MPLSQCVTPTVGCFFLSVALIGCGGSETTTSTTVPTTTTGPATSTEPVTTTSVEVGPQPLPTSGFLEAGEYATTLFEPRVLFRIEDNPLLFPDQGERLIELMNRRGEGGPQASGTPRRAIAFHSVWLGLSPDEIIERLQSIEHLELGAVTDTEVAGYPSLAVDGSAPRFLILWDHRSQDAYYLEPGMQLRFIIVDTPAGSVLINVEAHTELWDDFLPVAEEILAGISFPDLD